MKAIALKSLLSDVSIGASLIHLSIETEEIEFQSEAISKFSLEEMTPGVVSIVVHSFERDQHQDRGETLATVNLLKDLLRVLQDDQDIELCIRDSESECWSGEISRFSVNVRETGVFCVTACCDDDLINISDVVCSSSQFPAMDEIRIRRI